MIRIKGRGAVYGEAWYDEEPPGDCGADIVLYRQREAPITDSQITPFLSMVTDLSADEGAIMEKFGKDCRYKIRRAETKDGLHLEFIIDPERAGINKFKKEFGGQRVRTYNCTVPVTLKGRVWLSLRDAWRRLKQRRGQAHFSIAAVAEIREQLPRR